MYLTLGEDKERILFIRAAACRILLFVTLNLFFALTVTPQKGSLPENIDEQSSLADILKSLKAESLPFARIGLNFNAVDIGDVTDVTRYSEFAVFGKGFRLENVDNCTIRLITDDVALIHFSTMYPNPANGSLSNYRRISAGQSKYSGEISIMLDELSETAGRRSYILKKDPEQTRLLGSWRSEYKVRHTKSGSLWPLPSRDDIRKAVRNPGPLQVKLIGSGPGSTDERMIGDTLTVTFDEKASSERFDALFRLAIKKCGRK
jgi:hypothetical protein